MARGRRPGKPDTREAILAAARDGFARHGYDGASVRGIAGAAGVDPALVHHYFGSKDALFVAAMRIPVNPAEVVGRLVAGGLDGLGERIVGTFLSVWDGPARPAIVAVLRGALTHKASARMFREFVTDQILRRALTDLRLPDARLRGSLAASQLLGLAIARYVLGLEPLATLPAPTVVAAVGPTLQRYLTGPLDGAAQPDSETWTGVAEPPDTTRDE